ncbi:MAG: putative histidine kinase, classic [Verrucomicrobiales bacterium]|nr:putative histidine kinase, classic [Verrucomicrobiales bacterium]
MLFVALTFALHRTLEPFLGIRTTFGFFLLVTAVATWWGGSKVVLIGMAVGYLAEIWLFNPAGQTSGIFPLDMADFLVDSEYVLAGLIVLAVGSVRRTKDRTRQAHQNLEKILERMPVGVLIAKAPTGQLIYHNEQAGKICGPLFISRGCVNEYQSYRGLHPDGTLYEPQEWPVARTLISGELVTNEEVEFPREDGSRLILSISSAPIRDSANEIEAAVLSFYDITARREVEDQLQAILQNATAVIFLVTGDGYILRVNRHWEKMFHLQNEQVQGKSFAEIFPRESAEAFLANNQQVLARRAPMEFEETVTLPEDGLHTFQSIKAPLFDLAGNAWAIVGVATDITERQRMVSELKGAQEKLSRHAVELERKVAERTAHLEETIQSLEGVCYHIAHDLRAPLRSMQGFSSLLLATRSAALTEEEKDFVHRIGDSAIHMDGLIHDLLEYGQLSHAHLPCGWVELDGIVKLLLTHWLREIQAAEAKIEVRGPLPRVWANPKVLEQILANLLSNGLKYVAVGATPHIQIWAEEDDVECRIFVKDHGIGIEPGHYDKIFQVFERLHSSEQQYPGTGIGLAIVRKGVQRLGGRVWVCSVPGQGSCFGVALPKSEQQCALHHANFMDAPRSLAREMARMKDEG